MLVGRKMCRPGKPAAVASADLVAQAAVATVWARPGRGNAPLAFSTVNRFCMARLRGRAGRSTTQNGGFRRGQAAGVVKKRKEARVARPQSLPTGVAEALSRPAAVGCIVKKFFEGHGTFAGTVVSIGCARRLS